MSWEDMRGLDQWLTTPPADYDASLDWTEDEPDITCEICGCDGVRADESHEGICGPCWR